MTPAELELAQALANVVSTALAVGALAVLALALLLAVAGVILTNFKD